MEKAIALFCQLIVEFFYIFNRQVRRQSLLLVDSILNIHSIRTTSRIASSLCFNYSSCTVNISLTGIHFFVEITKMQGVHNSLPRLHTDCLQKPRMPIVIIRLPDDADLPLPGEQLQTLNQGLCCRERVFKLFLMWIGFNDDQKMRLSGGSIDTSFFRPTSRLLP